MVDPDDWERAGLAQAAQYAIERINELDKMNLADWSEEEFASVIEAAVTGYIDFCQGVKP